MSATRPTCADPKPNHDEDTCAGTPFSLHFDKLVIAVGAYSESDIDFFDLSFLDDDLIFFFQLSIYQESKNMPTF
jgi:hypothetical protein